MEKYLGILIAAGVVAGVGLLLGIILGLAGKLLAVAENEKQTAVRNILPGSNCGGCGYAGCDAYAKAIAQDNALIHLCPSVGATGAQAIGDIMGKQAAQVVRLAAMVHCAGSCEHTGAKYAYDGVETCEAAVLAPGGGQQQCTFGCLGFGSCAKVCPERCISMENGVAVVDEEACIACGKCVKTCPKNLISLQPAGRPYTVRCSSHDKGKDVKAVCDIGCIACGICAKNCPTEAITMDNGLAVISHEKCIDCGTCAEKCPVKIIF